MFSSICFAFLIEVEFMPAEAAQRHSMDQTVLMPWPVRRSNKNVIFWFEVYFTTAQNEYHKRFRLDAARLRVFTAVYGSNSVSISVGHADVFVLCASTCASNACGYAQCAWTCASTACRTIPTATLPYWPGTGWQSSAGNGIVWTTFKNCGLTSWLLSNCDRLRETCSNLTIELSRTRSPTYKVSGGRSARKLGNFVTLTRQVMNLLNVINREEDQVLAFGRRHARDVERKTINNLQQLLNNL